MLRHYRIIKLDLTNGYTDYEIPVDGSVCYYHQGITPLEVALNSNSNDKIPLFPKEKIEAPFYALYFSSNARPETATIWVSKPVTEQLTGGEVRVVTDVGFFNTMAQETWIGGHSETNAANRHFIGVTNLSSGYIGIIDQIMINATTGGFNADSVYLIMEEATYAGGNRQINKYAHAIAPGNANLQIVKQSLAGFPAGVIQTARILLDINGASNFVPKLNHFIVPPGFTLWVGSSGTANQTLYACFEWREEPIS